jgi:uncharacterized repeat protein (TIGR04138 family)
MQKATFEELLERALQRDARYARDAYLFVREALDYTQTTLTKSPDLPRSSRANAKPDEPAVRHVSGQELLNGIREYALKEFGPMVPTVLEEWGIRRCEDFGEIVFNMVETGLLAKTEKDSREDFKGGYDFEAAFRKPFLPSEKRPSKPAPNVSTTE